MSKSGDIFQQQTKYAPASLADISPAFCSAPSLYKRYEDSPKIEMPALTGSPQTPLWQTLEKRKSVRSYTKKPLRLQELSYLLRSSTGIQRTEENYKFRTAPSAGALYPIETYLVVNNINDLKNGLYHYSIECHHLEELQTAELGKELSATALGQSICFSAPVVFLWTAVFDRSKVKYGQRAYRYIYLEAGHIGQNLALAAVSLNLGSCQIGAFFDDEINRILGIDGEKESILYLSTAGYPA